MCLKFYFFHLVCSWQGPCGFRSLESDLWEAVSLIFSLFTAQKNSLDPSDGEEAHQHKVALCSAVNMFMEHTCGLFY